MIETAPPTALAGRPISAAAALATTGIAYDPMVMIDWIARMTSSGVITRGCRRSRIIWTGS